MPTNLCEIDVCENASIESICRIRPQDFDISGCGVPQVPSNARFIDLYRTFVYSIVLGAADSGTDILLDEKRSVDSNADFLLHKISPIGAHGPDTAVDYYLRFQWPAGRYSSNALQDVQTWKGNMFTRQPDGSTRYIRVPAGRFIGIGLQNKTDEEVNVVIVFEGVNRFYLR